MVNFKQLGDKAKELVEKRGGTDALKADAEELKSIATGQGSLADKAKAAAEALKDPGQRGAAAEQTPEPDATPGTGSAPQPTEGAPEARPAPASKGEGNGS